MPIISSGYNELAAADFATDDLGIVTDSSANTTKNFKFSALADLLNNFTSDTSISNDSVLNITPTQNFGLVVVVNDAGDAVAMLFDVSNGANGGTQFTMGNGIAAVGNYTGSTGSSNNNDFTVSADGTNGEIDIENRTGSSVTVRVWILV